MTSQVKIRKNIFIVDDDVSITQMLCLLLETRGYEVSTSPSANEAIAKINSKTDLILLDLILPDEGGFELCRRLKDQEDTRHIPIIIISGNHLSGDVVEGLYLGADDYLVKPVEYEELIARMEAVMRRRSMFQRKDPISLQEDQIIKEIRHIIDQKLITAYFQPIFLTDSLEIIGFEALCRAQTETALSNPELLFKAAIQFGFYHDLEMMSWEKATLSAKEFLTGQKLFLNCNPYLVECPKFLTIQNMFKNAKIRSEDVVLEITERSAVSDFKLFFQQLSRFRDEGFQFAVDDVGGGYASLESIVEVKPEVVKIDRHIITNIDKDPYKKSIVRFIVAFCLENNILSVAEGVETKGEFDTVRELNVSTVQGYYCYKPDCHINPSEIQKNVQEKISFSI